MFNHILMSKRRTKCQSSSTITAVRLP
nr:unnamed protein product [Callosobruchus chinensis]